MLKHNGQYEPLRQRPPNRNGGYWVSLKREPRGSQTQADFRRVTSRALAGRENSFRMADDPLGIEALLRHGRFGEVPLSMDRRLQADISGLIRPWAVLRFADYSAKWNVSEWPTSGTAKNPTTNSPQTCNKGMGRQRSFSCRRRLLLGYHLGRPHAVISMGAVIWARTGV